MILMRESSIRSDAFLNSSSSMGRRPNWSDRLPNAESERSFLAVTSFRATAWSAATTKRMPGPNMFDVSVSKSRRRLSLSRPGSSIARDERGSACSRNSSEDPMNSAHRSDVAARQSSDCASHCATLWKRSRPGSASRNRTAKSGLLHLQS